MEARASEITKETQQKLKELLDTIDFSPIVDEELTVNQYFLFYSYVAAPETIQ